MDSNMKTLDQFHAILEKSETDVANRSTHLLIAADYIEQFENYVKDLPGDLVGYCLRWMNKNKIYPEIKIKRSRRISTKGFSEGNAKEEFLRSLSSRPSLKNININMELHKFVADARKEYRRNQIEVNGLNVKEYKRYSFIVDYVEEIIVDYDWHHYIDETYFSARTSSFTTWEGVLTFLAHAIRPFRNYFQL
jgi:hypothetical protein